MDREKRTEYLKLFGLGAEASMNDVKKAFRTLAKRHHPDAFPDESRKQLQQALMARLNEAYRALTEHYRNLDKTIPSVPVKEETVTVGKEKDTRLYKKGVEFFNRYSGSISLKNPGYTDFDTETVEEKRRNLDSARECFRELIRLYPDSDWAYDAEERLKRIDRIMINLDAREDTNSGKPLPMKDPGFYFDKFRKMFGK